MQAQNQNNIKHACRSKIRTLFILIAAFALTGTGCGGSSKKDEPADGGQLTSDAAVTEDAGITDSDAGITDGGASDDCSPGHFGLDCAPCTCRHGACDEGKEGNGKCRPSSCVSGWGGENCDQCVGADGTAGLLTDPRDNNREYKTTLISCQEWMAENAKYQNADVTCFTNTEADADFLNKYGCIYSWEDAKKVCPDGWRLPTSEEFTALLQYVESKRTGDSLFAALAADSEEWQFGLEELKPTEITDEFGFSALPAGACGAESRSCGLFGHLTGFWTSTGIPPFGDLLSVAPENVSVEGTPMTEAFSVRCLRDESGNQQ